MRIETFAFLALVAFLPGPAQAAAIPGPVGGTYFKNVVVPPEKIRLEMLRGDTGFFQGEAIYDLEFPLDSVRVHAYVEEVPISPYIFSNNGGGGRQTPAYGAASWKRIDSLCEGDIGWVSPRPGNPWSSGTIPWGARPCTGKAPAPP